MPVMCPPLTSAFAACPCSAGDVPRAASSSTWGRMASELQRGTGKHDMHRQLHARLQWHNQGDMQDQWHVGRACRNLHW